jgi:hypothetical protein
VSASGESGSDGNFVNAESATGGNGAIGIERGGDEGRNDLLFLSGRAEPGTGKSDNRQR